MAPKTQSLICAILLALGVTGVHAQSYLADRVERLERILAGQGLSDLQLEMQRLREEVRELRGLVERQQNALNTLRQQHQAELEARPRPAPAAEAQPRETPAATPSAELDERAAYAAASALLKQKRYDDAIGAFEALLARFPNGEYADNARYWLGETYYVKRDHAAALGEFQRVLENHPQSPKIPGSMLKIGYIHAERNDRKAAKEVLEGLIEQYPTSAEAKLARSRLERLSLDPR